MVAGTQQSQCLQPLASTQRGRRAGRSDSWHRHPCQLAWLCKRSFLLAFLVMSGAWYGRACGQTSRTLPYAFTLSSDATTSAGVFTSSGTLVKTLWSGVKYTAGTYPGTWDGLTDEGAPAPDGDYLVKVVSNNVQYEWQGVVGNTSQSFTGSTVHHSNGVLTAMASASSWCYYAVGYSEHTTGFLKFNVANPQVKYAIHPTDGLYVRYMATDGTYVYWGGQAGSTGTAVAATKVSDDGDVKFPMGKAINAEHNYSTIDYDATSMLSGLAVQKTGNYLFIAHATANQVRVLNKTTGALVRIIAVQNPRELAVANDNKLWVVHGTAAVEQYSIAGDGTLTSTGLVLRGVLDPVALAVSPDNATLLVADGTTTQVCTPTTSHQVKAFNASTGAPAWVLGQAGGYATDPTVANDKFYLANTKVFTAMDWGTERPYLSFQPDGSFWVGDVGNCRSQHFAASRQFLATLQYMGYSYSAAADPNNPTRVFCNYLEFAVDYSKPLSPDNGSWRFVRNWSYGRQANSDDQFRRMECVTTLSNGHTYCLAMNTKTFTMQVVELSATGNLRFTGISTPNNQYKLYADGSLWSSGYNQLGQPATWKRQALTGFDSHNNPQWGPETLVASSPPLTSSDPVTVDGGLVQQQAASSGVLATFCNNASAAGRGSGWHLGGVQASTGKWLFKTSSSTGANYTGPYPADGTYDIGIGNAAQYTGTFAQAVDRNIFWGYRGEFWKQGQTNKWNHYLDNGLFVGQFGQVRVGGDTQEAPAGMAGNVLSGTFVKVGADYYFYHCDESYHGGIHRWKISGLNTIAEQTVATLTLGAAHGVLAEYFTGADLDNVNLTSSAMADVVQVAPQTNSARWTGFIEPLYNQPYTFYASASKKVRLWVNGNLVINQWGNNSQAEFSSAALALEAGKRYAIRMEISGGSAALSWSSASQAKQLVPKASLYAAPMPDPTNLMQGLLPNGTLENGLYGWSRGPNANYGQLAVYGNKWQVLTNVRTTSKLAPDVNAFSQPPASGLTFTVSRNLTASTTAKVQWSITGKLTYPTYDYDRSTSQNYWQVLDDNNRVIARISHQEVAAYVTYRLNLNNKVVAQTNFADMQALATNSQAITLTATAAGITLKYGNLPAITAPPLDPASNWQHPKTMQVLFYSSPAREQEVNMADMHFVSSTEALVIPEAPALVADDIKNILSATHSLGTSELMVSENNGDFKPYSKPINVGNAARAAGYWRFKVKAAAGRAESPVSSSPKFTASFGGAPLPVKLLFFKANATGSQVLLTWGTASEENTKAFVVEKSVTGAEFSVLGTVAAGNPTSNYSLVDPKLPISITYYRLKILDADSSFTYSPVVSVASKVAELTVYPNPAQDVLHVQYPASASGYLSIWSVTGAQLGQLALEPGTNASTFDIRALPQGIYILQYSAGSFSLRQQFIKQ